VRPASVWREKEREWEERDGGRLEKPLWCGFYASLRREEGEKKIEKR
jgi:hypothetical protein